MHMPGYVFLEFGKETRTIFITQKGYTIATLFRVMVIKPRVETFVVSFHTKIVRHPHRCMHERTPHEYTVKLSSAPRRGKSPECSPRRVRCRSGRSRRQQPEVARSRLQHPRACYTQADVDSLKRSKHHNCSRACHRSPKPLLRAEEGID